MTKEDIKKEVELELQWLKYYSHCDSKVNIDESKSLYDQLKSIGYTKRNIDLDKRCSFLRFTSDSKIIKDTNLNDLIKSQLYRDNKNNVYTALEVYMIKYPEENNWILEGLL